MTYKPYISGEVNATLSSTTALNNGQQFDSGWVDVSEFASLILAIATDQDGTYSIQFSPDGSNADSVLTRYHKLNEINVPHRFTITRKYARVYFDNDSGSNQTYFRAQTLLSHHAQPLNNPTDGTLSQDYDATVVRPTDFKAEVALGLREGVRAWNRWARNGDIDTGTETIWPAGGTITRMTSADTLTLVSSATADDDGDTGANTVTVYGVDANYDYQEQTYTLDGTTPVVTTGHNWLGVTRMKIASAGSGKVAAGDITAVATTAMTEQCRIETGQASSRHGVHFVPRNEKALMDYISVNVIRTAGGADPEVTTFLLVEDLTEAVVYEPFQDVMDVAVENYHPYNLPPFVIQGPAMLEFRSTTDTDNTIVNLRFSLVEHREVDA